MSFVDGTGRWKPLFQKEMIMSLPCLHIYHTLTKIHNYKQKFASHSNTQFLNKIKNNLLHSLNINLLPEMSKN